MFHDDTSNYRGISLSCLPAKLFELAIQKKTSHLLGSDELQFGFKSKTSTTHAFFFFLKMTVVHFNSNGSNVYVAFLDCTRSPMNALNSFLTSLNSRALDTQVPLMK